MIWVLSGTSEGDAFIRELKRRGVRVLASAVTAQGAENARSAGADEVVARPLDREMMERLISRKKVDAVVDATHPFAVEASRNAIEACRSAGARYVRLERPEAELPESRLIHTVDGFEEAAETAFDLGETVLSTCGVRNIHIFYRRAKSSGKRLIAKVLPTRESMERCLGLGMAPKDIIGIYGALNKDMYRCLIRWFSAHVLVTKESGPAGGLEDKVRAALEEDIPVVVVRRPQVDYPSVARSPEKVLEILEVTED